MYPQYQIDTGKIRIGKSFYYIDTYAYIKNVKLYHYIVGFDDDD